LADGGGVSVTGASMWKVIFPDLLLRNSMTCGLAESVT
jgi:hypothetical protein